MPDPIGEFLRGMNDSNGGFLQSPALPSLPRMDVTINPAAWMYERLGNYIQRFEANLDSDQEVGARLVSFGQVAVCGPGSPSIGWSDLRA